MNYSKLSKGTNEKSLRTIAFLLLFFAILSSNAETASFGDRVLWGNLSPGSYDVGFRSKTFIDKKRVSSSGDSNGRPIEIMIWYPAVTTPGKSKMTFKDYVLSSYDFRKGYKTSNLQDWLSENITGKAKTIDRSKLNKILGSKMFAVHNAQILRNRFPLVLWTTRHGTAAAQSVLSEFLASHGFVVAYARYADEPMPFPWAIKTAKERSEVFSTHLEDLKFSFKSLSKEKNIDASKTAILSWSYAAEFSPAIQMSNPDVKLVIGFSSNPLSSSGLYQGNAASSRLIIDKLNVPYVIMSERIGPNGSERVAPEILNRLQTESYFISFPELTHGNFNVLEGMIPGVFNIQKVQPWSKGGTNAVVGYEATSQYALHFLNKYLQKKRGNLAELKGKFPKDFVKLVRFRKKGN